jgi:hypothetical protein
MEKVFQESQVRLIIDKAVLDGKITSTQYYIDFIDSEISEKEENFEFLNENQYHRSEQWIECNSALRILYKVRSEFEEILKVLEKRKAEI